MPPRTMSRLNLFLEYLRFKTEDATRRALNLTPNGNGSRLLMSIIKRADLETLLLPGDPKNRTGPNLLPLLKDLEKSIDVRNGKHTTKKLFIQSRTYCFELMTASRRTNPLSEIPYDKPYDDPAWKTIFPLRVCDMSAADLRFSFHTDYLTYNDNGPSYVIYALDCFALISKFVAYYHAQTDVHDLDQTILNFLHSEVIVPALLNDTVALWMRGIYRQQLIDGSPLEYHTSTLWDNITTDVLGSDFNGAMLDVQRLRHDLINNNIGIRDVLSTLLVTVHKQDFSSYYKELWETTGTPNEQPYIWVDCIKNLGFWEFILLVSSYVETTAEAIALRRLIKRDLRFWLMMRPWQEIHGSIPLRTTIRSRLQGMMRYLDSAN